MNRALAKFLGSYGWFGFVRLAFAPVTGLLTGPVQLLRSLWNCRVLLTGRWGDYPHFNPHAAINSLFYWTRALDFQRHGRHGISPTTGLGSFRLDRLFYYTRLSLQAFRQGGCVTLLAGMFGWLLLHLLWLNQAPAGWLALVLALTLCSTTFYALTFGLQNYNVLGWMFLPLGLSALHGQHWWLAGLAWLLASLGSFTAVVAVLPVLAALALRDGSWWPLLTAAPALGKLLLHLLPLLRGLRFGTFATLAKAIGLTGRAVRYHRSDRGTLLSAQRCVLFILYLQYLLVGWWLGDLPVLFLVGLATFLVNSTFFRFADEQSMYILLASLALPEVILGQDPILLGSFWLLISPAACLLPLPEGAQRAVEYYKVRRPFDIRPLRAAMVRFLAPAPAQSRLLMAYDDPRDQYVNLFDGYRVNMELLDYVASEKTIHYLPDWWAVFDLNYRGAPDFWGRSPAAVTAKMREWQADLVVVYQPEGEEVLDPIWTAAGFKQLAAFRWADFAAELEGAAPLPNWWLLKGVALPKSDSGQAGSGTATSSCAKQI